MFRETQVRSVTKAVSWRIFASLTTTAIVFIFTGQLALSLGIAGVEFLSKIGLFWVHERAWNQSRWGRKRIQPTVVWFTGLSGSGKSTVADWVAPDLEKRGLSVERLDGDSVRSIFPNTGFSREDRDAHIRRVGFLASKLEQHGVYVVASFVSPYEESREFVRGLCTSFMEIYVSTPIEECERRDVKGLYAKARRGEISSFTGISDPFEVPKRPDLVLDTTDMSVELAGREVLRHIRQLPASL